MNNKSHAYDCAVIGAGIGGLTTACLLAKKGNKVVVFEKNNYPGGYCSTFLRKEYRFESAIHAINGCGDTGRTREILSMCGVFKKISFLKPRDVYRIVLPGIDLRFPQQDVQSFVKILHAYFPIERTNIDNFFREVELLFRETVNTDYAISSSLIWKYKNLTLKDFLDNYFKNEMIKALLAQYWGYLGVPPSKLSAIHYLYMFWDYIANGAFYPEGGSEGVARLLHDEIIESGGEVFFGSEVKKVISTDGKIINKLLLKNGHECTAEVYISNISAKTLIGEMLEGFALPESLSQRTKTTEQSLSAFVIYLGLNKSLGPMGITDYEIFLNSGFDCEKHYQMSLANDLAESQLAVTIYSNLDKTACPDNKSVLSIFALANYDEWKKMTRTEYTEKKSELSAAIIKRCSSIIPDLDQLIDVMEVATPLTLENYSGSTKGALYGWVQDISQSSFRRQKPMTPIKNLYLTGAWTRPGGGFSSVVYSGGITAQYAEQYLQEIR